MSDRTPTSDESPYAGKVVKCPNCKRDVTLYPQLDGMNRPMRDRPFRFGIHAGTKWGRQCPNSGELESLWEKSHG